MNSWAVVGEGGGRYANLFRRLWYAPMSPSAIWNQVLQYVQAKAPQRHPRLLVPHCLPLLLALCHNQSNADTSSLALFFRNILSSVVKVRLLLVGLLWSFT